MIFNNIGKHKITAIDGNCNLFGVNIFNYDWKDTGEKVIVKDPLYKQKYEFVVYTVNIEGVTRKFATGEFSNCVWGFYIENK